MALCIVGDFDLNALAHAVAQGRRKRSLVRIVHARRTLLQFCLDISIAHRVYFLRAISDFLTQRLSLPEI
jgi:hypothetical protein